MRAARTNVVPVVLAFIEDRGLVLITRRPAGTHLAGYWEFPGGKVREGESFPAALYREICEEIGVSIAVHDELASTQYQYPDCRVELHLFRCKLLRGEPKALQVAEFRWVPVDSLGDYTFPPANTALFSVLAQH